MVKLSEKTRLGKEIRLLRLLLENFRLKIKLKDEVNINDNRKSISRLSNNKLIKLLDGCKG